MAEYAPVLPQAPTLFGQPAINFAPELRARMAPPTYTTGGGFGTPPQMPGPPGPLDLIGQPDINQFLPFLLPAMRFQPRPATTQPRAPLVPQVMPPEGVLTPEVPTLEPGMPMPRSLSAAAAEERGLNLSGMPENVRTPEFRNWFGNSQVVDAEGRPLTAYHGTTADFSSFSPTPSVYGDQSPSMAMNDGDVGVWFSSSVEDPIFQGSTQPQQLANRFAGQRTDIWNNQTYDEGGNVMPVYLRVENPRIFNSYRAFKSERDGELFGHLTGEQYRQELQRQGFDGIRIRESSTDGGFVRDDWVIFEPTQIKSIHNPGAFDPNNPDILAMNGSPLRGFLQGAA